MRVDEVPRVVIEVMPPGRRFPEETDLWTPLIPDAAREKRDNRELMLFGRLGDGVKMATARPEVAALPGRLVRRDSAGGEPTRAGDWIAHSARSNAEGHCGARLKTGDSATSAGIGDWAVAGVGGDARAAVVVDRSVAE